MRIYNLKTKHIFTDINTVMKRIVAGILCGIALCCHADTGYDLKKDFAMLDTVVANMDRYINATQKRINEIKMKNSSPTDMDWYILYKSKFAEYIKFCSDSAIAYAHLCRQTTMNAGMDNELKASDIDLAYATVLQGNYIQADSIIKGFGNIDELPEALRRHAAIVYIEFNIRLTLYANTSQSNAIRKLHTLNIEETWQQYAPYLPDNDWMTDYYKAMCTNTDMKQQLMTWINSANKPSIKAAMLYLAMAKQCKNENDGNAFCHYLIQSAVNDIMSANREASSLILLLHTPFIEQSSRRAVEYAMASIKTANGYNDKARSFNVVKANSTIMSEYMEMQKKMAFNRKVIFILLAVIVVMSATLLWMLARKLQKKSSDLDTALN